MNFHGNIFDYFIAFGSGVVVSFTPCVYPLIPITVSVITGVNTKGSRLSGFFLSLIYVLGLAVTYSALGLVAALTGKLFGQIQNHPATYLVTGALLIFFGLVLLEVVNFPSLGIMVQQKVRPRNAAAIFVMGLASGLLVGPCTAPALGTLLWYASTKQNILHAMSLLFVFAYGVGTSLILVGTFGGLLSRMPRSGTWMVWIKKGCGVLLLVVGVYFWIKVKTLI